MHKNIVTTTDGYYTTTPTRQRYSHSACVILRIEPRPDDHAGLALDMSLTAPEVQQLVMALLDAAEQNKEWRYTQP